MGDVKSKRSYTLFLYPLLGAAAGLLLRIKRSSRSEVRRDIAEVEHHVNLSRNNLS